MRDKGSPAELEHRRLLAVQRVLEGYSAQEVAEFLGVDPRSVRRWVAAYRQEGGPGLSARPAPGRPPKLTSTQEKIVRRWLADKPTEHGFATDLWTGPRLAALIRQEFGIQLHPWYLSTWLRARGFTPQKPRRVPHQRDPEVDRRVAPDPVAAHQKKARRQGAHIALIDESGVMMAPLVRRTWAPRGQTPELDQCGGRQKVSVAAALWLSPRRDRLGLYFQTLPDGYFDNWYVAAFLEAMLRELAGRFVVVWDGGTMHRGDPIRQLMSHFADRLSLEDLPPWAPMLSPVEPLWGWLKYDQLCNFGPRDTLQLNERVIAELTAIREDQAFLRNLYHASELPLPRTLLS